jgi:hypothetical protein
MSQSHKPSCQRREASKTAATSFEIFFVLTTQDGRALVLVGALSVGSSTCIDQHRRNWRLTETSMIAGFHRSGKREAIGGGLRMTQ